MKMLSTLVKNVEVDDCGNLSRLQPEVVHELVIKLTQQKIIEDDIKETIEKEISDAKALAKKRGITDVITINRLTNMLLIKIKKEIAIAILEHAIALKKQQRGE